MARRPYFSPEQLEALARLNQIAKEIDVETTSIFLDTLDRKRITASLVYHAQNIMYGTNKKETEDA